MKNNGTVFRRILSLFMAIVICITMQDMAVFAATDASQAEEGAAAVLADSEQKASVEEIQKVEKAIVKGLQRRKDFIPLEGYQVTSKELSSAFMSMAYRFPQYFVSGFVVSTQADSDLVSGISIGYSVSEEEAGRRQKEMEQAASEIIDTINSSPRELKDYEKAWLVCQWLAETCEYGSNYNPSGGMNSGNFDPELHTAYSALVKKQAVCDGYATAYQYIMRDLLGIPCLVVINSDRSHVWNMVKIDGKYYHVDVTWARNALEPSAPSGKYFLLTDEEIRALDASSHGAWSGPYDMEAADGPSYAERNPLWSVEDNFNQAERGSGIVYYEGCYYFAAYHNIYRVADLLDYEESKRQRVCQTDNNTAEWASPVVGMWISIQEYHDCLYFHGRQRIYRLNLADKSEEERTIQPGNHLNLAEDITKQTVSSADGDMWKLLDVSGSLDKKVPTVFIYDFKVGEDENKDQAITFQVSRNPQAPLQGRPYCYLVKDLSGDIEVAGQLGIGQELTATAKLSPSLKPDYHDTAQIYYRWYRDDLPICRNTSGVYTPTEEDIGKTLRVVVTSDNYKKELSKEIGMIPKQTPALPDELPTGLTGAKGDTLDTVILPEDYEWKDPDTLLVGTGKLRFPAVYCPDSEKYNGLDVSLEVNVGDCNHSWGNEKVTKPAKCQEPGEKTYTCRKCGETKVEVIPKRGTQTRWDAGTVIKKANCGETGIMEYKCVNCGETKTETIPKQGYHNWKRTGKVTKEPTATSKGTYTTTCAVCSTPKTYSLIYAKTGNFTSGMTYLSVYSSTGSTGSVVGKLAKNAELKVFEEGSDSTWTKIYYSHGNYRTAYVKSAYVVTKAGGGTPNNKTLKIGDKVTGKMGSYKVTGKDTVEYTKATASATVTIPVTLKAYGKTYKVTSVAAKLLKNNKKVKKVVICSNITKIGAEAFSGCKNLKTITIKSSKLKSVGKNAIKNIYKRARITCPKKKKADYKKLFKKSTGYKKTMKIA